MTEEIPYRVTGQIGEIEFRTYPAIRVASVSGYPDNEAFGYLFRYISGNNRVKQKIPMTAPVITTETIPMTAPVISDAATMSFVMPEGYTRDDLPEPLEPGVRIEEIPARTVAVIRFTGRADPRAVEDQTARLLAILAEHQVRVIGSPFLMRYNAPFVPGFLRRNEAGVPIATDAPVPG
jgi:effector-binding domain-containing protein